MRPNISRKILPARAAVTVLLAALACDSRPKAPEHAPSESATAVVDARTAVVLPAHAQQAVLREMRQMLGAMGGALSAAAKGDTAAVLAALQPAGSAAAADPALEAMLPDGWKTLAERTHSGFDTLMTAVRHARTAQAVKDTVLSGLGHITASCTGCHETFRVTTR